MIFFYAQLYTCTTILQVCTTYTFMTCVPELQLVKNTYMYVQKTEKDMTFIAYIQVARL